MKVALSGSHSTGKTTLLTALRSHYGDQISEVSEIARSVCERREDSTYFQRGQNSPLRQFSILAYQVAYEAMAMNRPVLVTDRSIVDSWAYSKVLFPEWVVSPEGMEASHLVKTWMSTYDLVLYLPVQFPLHADGLREKDEAFRAEINLCLRSEYDLLEVPIVELPGDSHSQAELAVSNIEERRRVY